MPARMHELRAEVAQASGLTVDQLPFVAELDRRRPGRVALAHAIETVLGRLGPGDAGAAGPARRLLGRDRRPAAARPAHLRGRRARPARPWSGGSRADRRQAALQGLAVLGLGPGPRRGACAQRAVRRERLGPRRQPASGSPSPARPAADAAAPTAATTPAASSASPTRTPSPTSTASSTPWSPSSWSSTRRSPSSTASCGCSSGSVAPMTPSRPPGTTTSTSRAATGGSPSWSDGATRSSPPTTSSRSLQTQIDDLDGQLEAARRKRFTLEQRQRELGDAHLELIDSEDLVKDRLEAMEAAGTVALTEEQEAALVADFAAAAAPADPEDLDRFAENSQRLVGAAPRGGRGRRGRDQPGRRRADRDLPDVQVPVGLAQPRRDRGLLPRLRAHPRRDPRQGTRRAGAPSGAAGSPSGAARTWSRSSGAMAASIEDIEDRLEPINAILRRLEFGAVRRPPPDPAAPAHRRRTSRPS